MLKGGTKYPEDTIRLDLQDTNCKEMSEVLLARSRGIVSMVQAAAMAGAGLDGEKLRSTMEQLDGNLELLERLLEDLYTLPELKN